MIARTVKNVLQNSDEEQPMIMAVAMDLWNWFQIPISEATETMSSSYVGQMILKFIDKFLWVLEKSSQWALPSLMPSENKEATLPELTRPLPWLLFLPTLFWLRIFREGLSFFASMIGLGPITSTIIFQFIQSTRRSLRAIKYNGMRNMRTKNGDKDEKSVSLRSWVYWIIIKLQGMMCYNAVIYHHKPENNQIVKKKSGENIVPSSKGESNRKKSPTLEKKSDVEQEQNNQPEPEKHDDDEDAEDYDASIFRQLVQDLEEFIDSDDDDPDYNVDDDEENDTSTTSTENVNNESFSQPEIDQNLSVEHDLTDNLSVHQSSDSTQEKESSHETEAPKTIEVSKETEIPKTTETPKITEVLKIVENGSQMQENLVNGSTDPIDSDVINKTAEVIAGSIQPNVESKDINKKQDESENEVGENIFNHVPIVNKKLAKDRKNYNRFIPRTYRKGISSSGKQKNDQSTVKVTSTVEQSVVKNSSTVQAVNKKSTTEQESKNSTAEEVVVQKSVTTKTPVKNLTSEGVSNKSLSKQQPVEKSASVENQAKKDSQEVRDPVQEKPKEAKSEPDHKQEPQSVDVSKKNTSDVHKNEKTSPTKGSVPPKISKTESSEKPVTEL